MLRGSRQLTGLIKATPAGRYAALISPGALFFVPLQRRVLVFAYLRAAEPRTWLSSPEFRGMDIIETLLNRSVENLAPYEQRLIAKDFVNLLNNLSQQLDALPRGGRPLEKPVTETKL